MEPASLSIFCHDSSLLVRWMQLGTVYFSTRFSVVVIYLAIMLPSLCGNFLYWSQLEHLPWSYVSR
jgi:hypothetical protein